MPELGQHKLISQSQGQAHLIGWNFILGLHNWIQQLIPAAESSPSGCLQQAFTTGIRFLLYWADLPHGQFTGLHSPPAGHSNLRFSLGLRFAHFLMSAALVLLLLCRLGLLMPDGSRRASVSQAQAHVHAAAHTLAGASSRVRYRWAHIRLRLRWKLRLRLCARTIIRGCVPGKSSGGIATLIHL